jgi:hypothetical protein
MQSHTVQTILKKQEPAGYWVSKEDNVPAQVLGDDSSDSHSSRAGMQTYIRDPERLGAGFQVSKT